MRAGFLETLDQRVVLADGAMGTMLYAKGVFINRCFDELNLVMPSLVKDVHNGYRKVGCEVLETNTFGANPVRLLKYGLSEKMREINLAGAQLARECAGDQLWVAGAVGPMGIRIEPLGPTSFDEAMENFKQQIQALVDGGVDFIILETFYDLREIQQALRAAREVCHLPVVAQMTIGDDGNSLDGASPEWIAQKLDEWGADMIGLNCSVGPHPMLEAIERMAKVTGRKLAAQPNAGVPRSVEGRNLYLCSPEYMATYAKRFIQAGVKLVGGCCGTTPEHLKAMANAVRALQPPAQRVQVKAVAEAQGQMPPIPLEQRSALGQKLAQKKFIRVVEIVPPRGCDTTKEVEGARLLAAHHIDGVNIPDGPRASARMSAQALAIMIQQKVGIEALLHYCCRDRNVLSMQGDLLGAYAMGLRNLIVITGDPPKIGNYPDATAVFDVDAIGLTNIVANLNRGMDLGGNPIGTQTGFVIGCGANPGAINLEEEIRRYEWKVDAGAQYAVTQPVFDVTKLETFLKRIAHVRIPVIAGLWPLTSYRNAEFMNNEVPGVSVPADVMERMRKADSGEKARQEGIRIAQEALLRLKEMVEGVQVSAPFGRYTASLEVLSVLEPARASQPG